MSTTPYANSLFEQPWWLDAVAPGQWEEALVTDANGYDLIGEICSEEEEE